MASPLRPLPLGQRIPDRRHAVSVSLPTMRDVIGYEEKDEAVRRHIASGYPRFVQHPCLRELAAAVSDALDLAGRSVWLCASARVADELAEQLGAGVAWSFDHHGIDGVAHTPDPALFDRARLFLQHTGGALSSRAAEDALAALGHGAPAPENSWAGEPLAEVRRALHPVFPIAGDGHLLPASSGMSAFWAAFRAIQDVQRPRGREEWVQLGWLYGDSIAILRKFAGQPGATTVLHDVTDLAGLERLFTERGHRIAGLVTEVPTNPLVQTADVPALSALCRRHGVHLVLDPSLQSAFNVEVLPHADLVVQSLTKYTASEGDVIAGLVVLNPTAPDADALRHHVLTHLEAPYARDLARLAAQIGRTADIIAHINAATPRVVAFLRAHPAVRDVWWSLRADTRAAYLAVARSPAHVGGVLSFTVKGDVARFYDRVRLAKGPSFGMQTTLLCPFLYLAHYDLVSSEAGRAELAAAGLDPDLLRMSVGCEPVEEILAALAEALD